MIHYADFEIGLHRHGAGTYTVETRFHLPDDDSEHFESAEAQFDFAGLRALAIDPPGYGQKLSAGLFASPKTQAVIARQGWDFTCEERQKYLHEQVFCPTQIPSPLPVPIRPTLVP